MTDPRTALEEAWLAIHHEGYPPENERDTCRQCDRFRRFLDAEAWTDAAMMLVPEGSWFVVKNVMGAQPLTRDLFVADVLAEGDKGRPICLSIPLPIQPSPSQRPASKQRRPVMTDATAYIEEAISALSLELFKGTDADRMEEVQGPEASIAIELDRIDAAIGPAGTTIFAALADNIRQAVVALHAAKKALGGR